jgi:hypothetical protein
VSTRPSKSPRSPPADSQRLAPHHPHQHDPTWGVAVTRHPQWFTDIHPFGLPLTCSARSERAPLSFPWASHPVITDHARQGGDRSWTLTEVTSSTSSRTSNRRTTHSVRLRVAAQFGRSAHPPTTPTRFASRSAIAPGPADRSHSASWHGSTVPARARPGVLPGLLGLATIVRRVGRAGLRGRRRRHRLPTGGRTGITCRGAVGPTRPHPRDGRTAGGGRGFRSRMGGCHDGHRRAPALALLLARSRPRVGAGGRGAAIPLPEIHNDVHSRRCMPPPKP